MANNDQSPNLAWGKKKYANALLCCCWSLFSLSLYNSYRAAKENWFYDGMKLKIVNHNKYLGIVFSTGVTFSYELKDTSDRARKGVLGILSLQWSLGEQCLKLFFKLFDCQIQWMLTYGSEVWGIMADYCIIQRVHLFGCQMILEY